MKVWYVIGILMLAINCTASVYYVNNIIGNDSHDGLSSDKPFKTVRQAMSKLSPGDTLIMASGCVFHESMVFQRSGTPSAPVTVEAGGSILSGREKVPAGNWRQIENGLWLNGNHVQTGA